MASVSDTQEGFCATPLRIRAELARHGLMPHQVRPWWNPDTERTEAFLETSEGQASVVRFVTWLDAQMRMAQNADSEATP